MALYVYGIMRAGDAGRKFGDAGAAREVQAVEHERIAALVSVIPDESLRLRKDNILGHADVLQAALEHGPVLPLRFGTVLVDEEAVRRELLAPGVEQLHARLDALDGKVEMQVKIVYSEDPLLRSVLASDSRLAAAAQRVRELPADATHFDRLRIGEAVAQAIETRRLSDTEVLLAALRPHALAASVSEPHHERAMLNAAFLVERNRLKQFDAAVEAASQERGAEAEFKLIGPLPPYSFADQQWEAEEVRAAWA